jgi:hypothetical protein
MNPKTFGGSIWLLLFGAATVLLIGAFARFDTSGQTDDPATNNSTVSSADASQSAYSAPPAFAGVRSLPADLSPGLAEIIRMAQAHIADETILAYVQNSGQAYNPSADEILYLSDLGLSDKVVAALFKKPDAPLAAAPAPSAPPAAGPPPATAADYAMPVSAPESMIDTPPAVVEDPVPLENPQDSYFYDSLAPYGNWVQTEAGWGWQPMVASVNPDWLPYSNRGQWELTDDGWYWASDYSWGWAAFHYGRWSRHRNLGWVWIPGSVWAPAWVAWRNTTDGYAGWAALPPGVHFYPGIGLSAGPELGGVSASYGLNAATFTFVPQTQFLSRNVGRFAVPVTQSASLFKSSTPVNNYSVSGRRIVNSGVSAAQIAAATKAPVPKFAMKEVSSPDVAVGKNAGQNLAVFRPNPAAPAARSSGEPSSQPALINKTPRPGYTPSPVRAPIVSGNLQPPSGRVAESSSKPAAPAAKSSLSDAGDFRHFAAPSRPAPSLNTPSFSMRSTDNEVDAVRHPATGYPSYTPRSFNPAPSAPPATVPFNTVPQHNPPAIKAPASTPVESHGGGGQGNNSTPANSSSSSSSSSSSKTTK